MNARTPEEFLLVEEAEFFAPSSTDAISFLLAQYEGERAQIQTLADTVASGLGGVVQHFLEGNVSSRDRGYVDLRNLFDLPGAVKSLDSSYWAKALALTDVWNHMPQARRDAWQLQLNGWKEPRYKEGEHPEQDLPPFNAEAVRPTIASMLAMRAQFLGERVDGIFRGLSGNHVTNAPEAFGKRMIVERALTYYDTVEHSTAGRINDLRCVIAKFMGRDEPCYTNTTMVFEQLRCQFGEWLTLDGGAIRIKLFKKRTAHIEIHPLMAYRLNAVLASLYPLAIPAAFRTRPAKIPKEFQMLDTPLSFGVLAILQGAIGRRNENFVPLNFATRDNKAEAQQAADVLRSIGGVAKAGGFQFDYAPASVIRQIVVSGVVPDQRTHQFYPTPEAVALAVVDAAQLQDGQTVLEPSAGQGDLARHFPKEATTCVEIAPMHCTILKAQGFDVHEADFLKWAPEQEAAGRAWDVIAMNPPFSEKRAELHVCAASKLVAPNGRLVAIMPANYKGKSILAGWNHEWSDTFQDEFAGTSVSVAILTATRPQ